MTPLERSYRMVLAVYPPDYLAEREDEIVGTLLAAAPTGATRPSKREVIGLVRHGLGERLRRFGGQTRRHGLAGASALALACAAMLVTVVVSVQLLPSTAALPAGFVVLWASFGAATLVAHLASGRGLDVARMVVAALAAAMLIVGPASTLTPRRLFVPLAFFAMLASLRPRPGRCGSPRSALASA